MPVSRNMEDVLSKYHPDLPSLLSDFEIDPELPKEEYAFKAYSLLLTAKRNSDAMFLVIGRLLKDIRERKLFAVLDYESFNQFLNSEELGFSREKAYLCIRAYEYLVEHLELDPEKVGKLNIGRINMMIPVIKKIEEEQGKEAAISQMDDMNSLRHNDFVHQISESKKNIKPEVYFSEEDGKWHVTYWENMTVLFNKGAFV